MARWGHRFLKWEAFSSPFSMVRGCVFALFPQEIAAERRSFPSATGWALRDGYILTENLADRVPGGESAPFGA